MAQTDSNTSKNKFKHLLFHQRTLIEFMVKNGYKPAEIARELGVNRSTVSRELKRGSVEQIIAEKSVLKYFVETAQEIFSPQEMVCTSTLYRYIDADLLMTRNIDLVSKMSRKPPFELV